MKISISSSFVGIGMVGSFLVGIALRGGISAPPSPDIKLPIISSIRWYLTGEGGSLESDIINVRDFDFIKMFFFEVIRD